MGDAILAALAAGIEPSLIHDVLCVEYGARLRTAYRMISKARNRDELRREVTTD